MPRHYEIDAAWRAAIRREANGHQTVTTGDFVLELEKTRALVAATGKSVDRNICDGIPGYLHSGRGKPRVSAL